MAFDYINEAFKKLNLLEEQMFDTSLNGVNELSNFMDNDNVEDIVKVIDPEAENEEDLKNSYIGKVIINCNVCHSHIFENKEDIIISEDGQINVESDCPYCGEQEGFTIVGEIAPYSTKPVEEAESTDNIETEPIEETDDVVEITESKHIDDVNMPRPGSRATTHARTHTLKESVDEIELVCEYYKNAKDLMRMRVKGATVEEALLTILESDNFGVSYDDISNLRNSSKEEILSVISKNFANGRSVISSISDSNGDTYYEKDLPEYVTNKEFNNQLSEDFKEVSIKTEDQKLEMTSDENGKVTVTTEPIENNNTEAEMIVPVSDETETEILNNNDVEEPTDEYSEDPSESESDSEVDFDFDEVDEEAMDELGESYLRRVYENVERFKTTNVAANDTTLVVEGLIKFNSGATKKTGFIFEARDTNIKGQLRFSGCNKHLTESKDAFSLVGRVDNKKLIVESLKYNYKVNNDSVRGVIRRK